MLCSPKVTHPVFDVTSTEVDYRRKDAYRRRQRKQIPVVRSDDGRAAIPRLAVVCEPVRGAC